MENYILEKISGNARNGTFSATSISGTAKYSEGFSQQRLSKMTPRGWEMLKLQGWCLGGRVSVSERGHHPS